jgi:hypothetical protein
MRKKKIKKNELKKLGDNQKEIKVIFFMILMKNLINTIEFSELYLI